MVGARIPRRPRRGAVLATVVRRTTVNLPAAPVGPDNPLPALLAPADVHEIDERQRAELPPDMARQVGYAPLRSLLPAARLDGYRRDRTPTDLDALVIENERLRATVLPGLGGRVHSLVHKPDGRELLYRNPVFQPADFGLADAWYSGGIEWNIGATGHTPLSCRPVHAARVAAPDGGEMLRLWEWERLRDVPFQVDLWLPEDSDFLYVGVRVRNHRHHTVPVYWWSNIAVPENDGVRVLAPAETAWHFGYERTLSRIPVPDWRGADRTYPVRSEHAADFFYDVPDGERKWIAALDADGRGLAQTSTDLLSGRKLFVWGHGAGGRRWQRWLTEPGTEGYLEIQAGLARTQLEHVPLEPGAEFSWLEAYGPLAADPAAVHGADWRAARAAVADRLAAALPREAVERAYARWLPQADAEPKDLLAAGSGWGALEVLHGGHELPGTPFDPAGLGEQQRPWAELTRTGRFPESVPAAPPGPTPVAPHWRELLEAAPAGPLTEYHLGVAQWHAGDRAQAARSWERSLRHAETWWTLRCLAVADAESGHQQRAADRWLRAFRLAADPQKEADAPEAPAAHEAPDALAALTALTALAREAVPALLAADRPTAAAEVLDALPAAVHDRGRFRLLTARVLLALGEPVRARAVFDAGFEVDDLREGEEILGETWFAIAERLVAGDAPITDAIRRRARADHPLPEHYDFRMRPA
jgi:tetratricopeptide (TPR) repeat protein